MVSCKKISYYLRERIPQIEGAIFGRFQFIHPLKALIAKFIGGVAGIGMGFSLGREGPSVQMGGFIAKLIGKWGKANISEQRYLYTGGASAGLSSAFTAPLASTIFIIEEVEKFDSVKIAISSLLAAIISGWIASQIFTVNSYTLINTAYPDEMNIGEIAIAFILFSTLLTIIGKTFNYLLLRFQKQYRGSRIPVSIRILGIIIVTYILGYFFSGLVAGGEKFLLKEANAIHTEMGILVILIIIKLLFTTLCYATGFPGGIFLPAIGHRWTYRKIIRTSLDSDRNTLARAFWLFHANRNVSSICCSSEITHYRNHSNTRNDSKIQYVNTNNRCRRHNLFYQ